MQRGKFISFEGGEGAGKSTQIRHLITAFEKAGHTSLSTREPGGTPGAEDIRALLLKGDADKWDPLSEALLFYASRREHVEKVIKPAMEKGTYVVSDRFADSSMVYQGYGKGLGLDYVRRLHHLVLGNFQPDLTLWLDMDTKTGLARAISREGQVETRFEFMHASFHERVHAGFLHLTEIEPHRMVQIDAKQSIEAVHRAIITTLNERLGIALKAVV